MSPEPRDAGAPEGEADAARFAAAAALRSLNHTFVAFDGDGATHAAVVQGAEDLANRLRQTPARDRLALIRGTSSGEPTETFLPSNRNGFEDRAVAGWANPTSVEPKVELTDDRAMARITLGPAFEGTPNRAHGGIVAAAFDDVTGFIIGILREPAFTGELTVRFVAPVPVREELLFTAWLASRDGRKLYIEADARAAAGTDDERIVATCKATYITVPPERFAAAPDPR